MRLPRYARKDMMVSEQAKNIENILTFSPLRGFTSSSAGTVERDGVESIENILTFSPLNQFAGSSVH
jgi:hypothetical protein